MIAAVLRNPVFCQLRELIEAAIFLGEDRSTRFKFSASDSASASCTSADRSLAIDSVHAGRARRPASVARRI